MGLLTALALAMSIGCRDGVVPSGRGVWRDGAESEATVGQLVGRG